MRKRLIHKLIISTVIVAIACFVYSSFFYRISAKGQKNSTQNPQNIQENQEIQTSAILESQSKSMRNIRFHRRSK